MIGSRRLCAFALLLSACPVEGNLRERPRCDGVLNSTEESVDDAFDLDGDGYYDASDPDCQDTYAPEQLDCADREPTANPGGVEAACNEIDDDCDPATLDAPDTDSDGYTPCDGDCDDSQPLAAPNLNEIGCDGIDNDCDTATLDGADEDADGFTTCDDCDDEDADVNPATAEAICNGKDDDCNTLTLDGDDFDGDTWVHCFDCDDNDPLRYPTATEICEDGIDQDCTNSDAACPPPSWSGLWSHEQINYSCADGQLVFNASSVSVLDNSPNISFTFVGGTSPGTTSGTVNGMNFTSQYFIGGLCDELYEFDGSFTSEDTFTGTLTATFTDNLGGWGCIDCTNQSWVLHGTR
jgi:hypothetical protein